MAYKSIASDLKTVRNQIQDETLSPYSGYSGSEDWDGSTNYVFSFHKKPAGGTVSDDELFAKSRRETDLPVIVDVGQVEDAPMSMRGGKITELPVMVRCFSVPDLTITFKGNKMESEELVLEKLNEIRHEFWTNNTIKGAFDAAGLFLPRGEGNGRIRQIDAGPNDFGAVLELVFWRVNQS